ncbi:hypothetical protein GCM10010869_21530 [Mesorhizobium tianshanense]|nr:hypothetical protein GCM10010869_21530 [Mesorhizobium tianshanense]
MRADKTVERRQVQHRVAERQREFEKTVGEDKINLEKMLKYVL